MMQALDDLIEQYPVGTKVKFRRYSQVYTGEVTGHTSSPKAQFLRVLCDKHGTVLKVQPKMVVA